MLTRSRETVADPFRYQQSIRLIEDLFGRHFFDRTWINTSQAYSVFNDLRTLGAVTPDADAFCRGFEQLFERIGISHVGLSVQTRVAAQLGRHFDTMMAGPSAVNVTWSGTVANLRVRTFMGQDTGPRITAALEEVVSNGAAGLIIDLRENRGGSFAMRHLVGHCIHEDVDAGALLGANWDASRAALPDRAYVESLPPWRGSSLAHLWHHLATHPVTRVQFSPLRPAYRGPIVVLINQNTASAAELAAEVLHTRRGATLLGEPTAGAMLVQRPFDVSDCFTLYLPVADYVSHGSGRIEGSGLEPDLITSYEDAPSRALSILSEAPSAGGPAHDQTYQTPGSGAATCTTP